MPSPRHSAEPSPAESLRAVSAPSLSSSSPATPVSLVPPSHRRFRFFNALIWYGLPSLIVTAVCVYVGLIMAWGVYPPMIPVEGTSMRPTLVTGDLVFVHSVDPKTLTVGQIVAVNVPQADVEKYNLPARVVHRISSIEETPSGLQFTTKGDNNPGTDVFKTPDANVVGEVTGHVPYVGMPFLFFRGIQGQIFLGSAAAIVLIYLLMGWAESRKNKSTDVIEALVLETRQLRELLDQAAQPIPRPRNSVPFMSARASRSRTGVKPRRTNRGRRPARK